MGLFKRCSNIGGAAHYINSILLKYDNCRPIDNSIIDKSIQPGSVVHGEDAQQIRLVGSNQLFEYSGCSMTIAIQL